MATPNPAANVIDSRLDPEAEILLRNIQATGFPGWSGLGLDAARAAILQMATTLAGDPEPVSKVEELGIRIGSRTIPASLYIPERPTPVPVMIYMHGGGWTIGNHMGVDTVVRALANRSGCAILSVDYRLAPEHKYPAALDDVWDSLQWLMTNADGYGLDRRRIAVGGDSSGANLAAAVALRCRDQGECNLQFQLLIAPPLDHDYETDSYLRFATGEQSALSRADVDWFHQLYVSTPDELDLPFVSPLRAGSVARLPRTLLICGSVDPLLNDCVGYARRLEEANVPVELKIYPGMLHGFWRMPGVLTKAREAIDYAGRRMAEGMGSEFREKEWKLKTS